MKNVKTSIDGKKLTIEVDLAQEFGPSKTGKTIIIASTEGNIPISTPNGNVVIGFNCYRKAA